MNLLSPPTFALLFVCMQPIAAGQTGWSRTEWNTEPAWVSESGPFKAVVSESRSRLIYLGPATGDANLLSAPSPLPAPTAKESAPNWGGHRFWLGPQSRWKWPPVRDWEFAAIAEAKAADGVLTLLHPRTDAAYPQLQREYAWEGGRLRCTVGWKGGGEPSYGMHVIAVDAPTTLSGRLHAWDRVPHGVVGINGDTPNTTDPLPHPAITVRDGVAYARTGAGTAKLGFYPQALENRRGEWTLVMHPGPTSGTPLESPDHGYLSQIWVGPAAYSFCELEQLTPFMLPAADGWCSSTVYLEVSALPHSGGTDK